MAFANNQFTYIYTNGSTNPTQLQFVNNAGYFVSYDLITYIFTYIIPPSIVRIFPLTYNYEVQEFLDINNVLRRRVKLRGQFIDENCSSGMYTTTCPTGSTVLSEYVDVVNYVYFNDNYTYITYIWTQETNVIVDTQTSAMLNVLSDSAFVTTFKNIICNSLINQMPGNLDAIYGFTNILQLCGSVTGNVGQNQVGTGGFTLGSTAI